MAIFITSANFVGRYAIPKTAYSQLDAFIVDNEESILIKLFGAELWKAIKATVTGTPPKPVGTGYLAIYDPFSEDYNNQIVESKGIVLMLCGFIFFDYMRQVRNQATQQGMVINTPDSTTAASVANLFKYENEAVVSYQAIQKYIVDIHPELFPPTIAPTTAQFNGRYKGFSNPVFS